MKKVLFGTLFSLASFALAVQSASALTVEPVLIDDLSLAPGASATRTIKLKNEGTATVSLKMRIYDVEASADESGFPQLVDPSKESQLAAWINQNSQTTLSLAPGETKQVPLYVVVPKNAEPGGHYAVVSWGTADPGETEGVGATVGGQAGVNLAIDVQGEVVEKGDIVSFATADGLSKYDRLPITFNTRINNGGNRHFKPTGSITVRNMFGKVVATLPFNAVNGGGNVLPRSTRSFSTTWDGGFAFGKYTADLSTTLVPKQDKAGASATFWVLPAGLLILWLIIAAVVILILVLLVKNVMMSMKK